MSLNYAPTRPLSVKLRTDRDSEMRFFLFPLLLLLLLCAAFSFLFLYSFLIARLRLHFVQMTSDVFNHVLLKRA